MDFGLTCENKCKACAKSISNFLLWLYHQKMLLDQNVGHTASVHDKDHIIEVPYSLVLLPIVKATIIFCNFKHKHMEGSLETQDEIPDRRLPPRLSDLPGYQGKLFNHDQKQIPYIEIMLRLVEGILLLVCLCGSDSLYGNAVLRSRPITALQCTIGFETGWLFCE